MSNLTDEKLREFKGTKVYGASDDLIEFEGDLRGEVGCYNTEMLLAFSDGTVLIVAYGKPGLGGVWGITVLRRGDMFSGLDLCMDEDHNPYSDVAHFKPGKLQAWSAKEVEGVR